MNFLIFCISEIVQHFLPLIHFMKLFRNARLDIKMKRFLALKVESHTKLIFDFPPVSPLKLFSSTYNHTTISCSFIKQQFISSCN